MDWIILVIAFILGAISMFMLVCIEYVAKQEKPANRVHFYVARDKDGRLWLYIGKPIRNDVEFHPDLNTNVFVLTKNLKLFGLKYEDYANLKWEDEPIEVFINMED